MITKAAINRNGLGRLIIHSGARTTTIWCSRIQISDYLRSHEWGCFSWNGRKFKDNAWRKELLN